MKVYLQSNLVVITPRRGVHLPLKSIPEAITQAGFQPGEMRVRGQGGVEVARVEYSGDEIVLHPIKQDR